MEDIIDAADDCDAAGSVGNYGWAEPPANASCSVTAAGGDFRVEVTLGDATFVNGARGTASAPGAPDGDGPDGNG